MTRIEEKQNKKNQKILLRYFLPSVLVFSSTTSLLMSYPRRSHLFLIIFFVGILFFSPPKIIR